MWPECVIIFVFLKESPGLKTDDGNMTVCRHQLGELLPLCLMFLNVSSLVMVSAVHQENKSHLTLTPNGFIKRSADTEDYAVYPCFLRKEYQRKKMSQIRKYLPPQILRARRSKLTGYQVCLVLKDSHAYAYMHFTSILIIQYAGSNSHACVRVSICMNVCLCIPPKGYGCSPTPKNADQ